MTMIVTITVNNNYDDDYDADAYTDTKALSMMLIAYDSGHLDPARMLHIIRYKHKVTK